MALVDGRTIGLALSGGGFRATLFGLGSVWRLNDAGLLGRLDRVTSVSGGSILAAVLAHRWSRLRFQDGRALNFEEEVVRPVRSFCNESIDITVGLLGAITPFRSAGDYLTQHYRRRLFGHTRMRELAARETNVTPLFVIYATNLQTGRNFRFRQDMIADYYLGMNLTADPELAVAVAASSAFPPMFSPVLLKTQAIQWTEPTWAGDPQQLQALRERIVLADGGVYDNLGLESLNETVKLVSDAGAPFQVQANVADDYWSQLGRVRNILIDQTRALRKRDLMERFNRGVVQGAYWGVGTKIESYAVWDRLLDDSPAYEHLDQVPTRLKAFDPSIQDRLVNWGYALADAAVQSRARMVVPPGRLPFPV